MGPSPIQNESSSLKNYNVNWLWIHVKTNCFQSPKTMKLTYATKGFITLVPHNASHERNYGPTSLEKHKSSLICKPFFWHQNNFNPSFLSRNKHKHFHPHKSYFSAKISQPQMALLYKERWDQICLAGHLTKKQQILRKSTKGRIIDHVTLVLCKITADKTFWKVLSILDFVWKPVKVVWIQRIWGLHAQKQTVCIHLQSEWDLHGWPNPPHTITREFAVN